MPLSVLDQIYTALLAEVAKVSPLGENGEAVRHWSEVENHPAAFTIPAEEDKEFAPTQSKEGVARFVVYTVCGGASPRRQFLELYRQVEKEIEDDPRLGGLCFTAQVTGFAGLQTAETISSGKYVADIFVEVHYRHTRASP